jgi:preprotein translocase subunit SecG
MTKSNWIMLVLLVINTLVLGYIGWQANMNAQTDIAQAAQDCKDTEAVIKLLEQRLPPAP